MSKQTFRFVGEIMKTLYVLQIVLLLLPVPYHEIIHNFICALFRVYGTINR
ncbi:hypothetical protein LY85_2013 [Clostridium sp. KNHs216]|nr:hypothetical protein LY85_2013 [Clostridium sp. KNHs216]